jgi:hypothetical protein
VIPISATGTYNLTTLTTPETQLVWTNSSAGAKASNIPGATGHTGYKVGVATTVNNGDTHTITPASGTVGNTGSFTFLDNQATGSNIPLMSDGNQNWIIL